MTRGVRALDRVAALIFAIILLAAGLALLVWGTGRVEQVPRSVDLGVLVDAESQQWWPWALGAAGVVLAAASLQWLWAHRARASRVGHLVIPGSGRAGRLLVSAPSVADAAAQDLTQVPGVSSANGTIRKLGDQLVARFTVTVDREADLAGVAQAIDSVSADLQDALGRRDLRCDSRVRVARRDQGMPRVD